MTATTALLGLIALGLVMVAVAIVVVLPWLLVLLTLAVLDRAHELRIRAARRRAFRAIDAERDRQDAKWGRQRHPDGTGPTLANRATAEAAKLLTDTAAAAGRVTWADILREEVYEAFAEDDVDKLRTELVQVAAVAVQWVEALDERPEPASAVAALRARRDEAGWHPVDDHELARMIELGVGDPATKGGTS